MHWRSADIAREITEKPVGFEAFSMKSKGGNTNLSGVNALSAARN